MTCNHRAVFIPLSGDYDNRTPIHLAAAEGQDKAVQYLIAKGADVNCKDRWGATALQDAVTSGHVQVAEQILSRGGTMATSLGAVAMCNAATEGDVRYLKLLIRCGVNASICFFPPLPARPPLYTGALCEAHCGVLLDG